MKKSFITLLLVLMSVAVDSMAQDMRSLFIEMPDSLIPLLTRLNREDCIDFIDAGMRARVTNTFDEESELITYTKDYIHLKSSANSSMHIGLLPCMNDTILCIINSVCAEACDSRISFYTKKWQRLDSKVYFREPTIEEFIIPSDSAADIADMCDIRLVKLSLNPTDHSITAEYTMPAYMSKEDSMRVAPNLRPIIYEWNGNKYTNR